MATAGSKRNFNPPFGLAPLHKPVMFLSLCLHCADFLARAELGCLQTPALFLTFECIFGLMLRKAMIFFHRTVN